MNKIRLGLLVMFVIAQIVLVSALIAAQSTVEVAVATRTIKAGTRIEASDLIAVRMAASAAKTLQAVSVGEAAGMAAVTDIPAGAPLTAALIQPFACREIFAGGCIEEGFEAVALDAEAVFIQPGYQVHLWLGGEPVATGRILEVMKDETGSRVLVSVPSETVPRVLNSDNLRLTVVADTSAATVKEQKSPTRQVSPPAPPSLEQEAAGITTPQFLPSTGGQWQGLPTPIIFTLAGVGLLAGGLWLWVSELEWRRLRRYVGISPAVPEAVSGAIMPLWMMFVVLTTILAL